MQTILSDPNIGGFDQVVPLINPDVGEVRSRTGEIFASLTKQDFALFYFAVHVFNAMTGDFYLTTAQTQLFENGRPNPGTAVEADFLRRVIGSCYAERKVVYTQTKNVMSTAIPCCTAWSGLSLFVRSA